MAKINAGWLELGCLLGAIVPVDFAWSFTAGHGELVVTWTWGGDVSVNHQDDVRASTFAELVDCLQRVDWAAERTLARASKRKAS